MRHAFARFAIALCVLACQPAASASFQPEGACVADGRAPGTYPDLEAKLPGGLGEVGPTSLDSGRSCSEARLGSLKGHGVTDLRYAGATWALDNGQSVAIVVFSTPPGEVRLDSAWIQEFYETGARASTKTENIEISHPTYDRAGAVYQLNTLNDLSFQSVVVWPADDVIHAVIVATQLRPGGLTRADHDEEVRRAIQWAAAGRQG